MTVVGFLLIVLFFIFLFSVSKEDKTISQYDNSDTNKEWEDWLSRGKWEKYKTYEELLQTNEWQEKRQKILKRDNFRCCKCNSTHNLNVHHKYYSQFPNGEKVKPWDYPDDALITLCKYCHDKEHQKHHIKVYYRAYDKHY